jgi:septal ring factor EnvC (AmiA/AmiB activator)
LKIQVLPIFLYYILLIIFIILATKNEDSNSEVSFLKKEIENLKKQIELNKNSTNNLESEEIKKKILVQENLIKEYDKNLIEKEHETLLLNEKIKEYLKNNGLGDDLVLFDQKKGIIFFIYYLIFFIILFLDIHLINLNEGYFLKN